MLQEDISKTNDSFERYKERISNFSGEFELGLFLFIAKKSILWIILFFALAFTGAKLYLRYTPPVYEASSTIQVQTANQANKLLDVENPYESDNGNNLAAAVELLRSKVFLKRVLSKLPLEVSYYAEGTLLNNEMYTSSPFKAEIRTRDKSIAGTKIYVDFSDHSKGVINYVLDGQNYSKAYTTNEWVKFPHFDIRVSITNYDAIERQQNAVKDNAYYLTVNDTAAIVNSYFQSVEVKLLNEEARTISISYKDLSPQKAADVVSAMTMEYTNFDIERKSESSKSILDFIDLQLDVKIGVFH